MAFGQWDQGHQIHVALDRFPGSLSTFGAILDGSAESNPAQHLPAVARATRRPVL